jgi:putative FmdB family regulatory protein
VPTYQYACTECGHAFEQVQSFSDDALTVCPECAGRLRKVFNAVGVVFKGSGFYRTDSRSSAERSAAAKDSTPAAAEKSDKAPAATTSSTSAPTKSESASSSTSTTSTPKSSTPA